MIGRLLVAVVSVAIASPSIGASDDVPGGLVACDRGLPRSSATVPFGGRDVAGVRLGGVTSPFFAASGGGFYALDTPAPSPRAARDPELELELRGPSRRRVGEPVDLVLSLTNRSPGPLVLAKPVDARHQPRYVLYLRDQASRQTYLWDHRGCACCNVDAMVAQDYRTLAPGETTRPGPWSGDLKRASVPRPGRYALWVAYVLCTSAAGGIPLGTDELRGDVHRGIHVSNALDVVVVDAVAAPNAVTSDDR